MFMIYVKLRLGGRTLGRPKWCAVDACGDQADAFNVMRSWLARGHRVRVEASR
jgi:hypothetical protein